MMRSRFSRLAIGAGLVFLALAPMAWAGGWVYAIPSKEPGSVNGLEPYKAFDTAAECEAYKESMIEGAAKLHAGALDLAKKSGQPVDDGGFFKSSHQNAMASKCLPAEYFYPPRKTEP